MASMPAEPFLTKSICTSLKGMHNYEKIKFPCHVNMTLETWKIYKIVFIVCSTIIKVGSEEPVFEAVLLWVKHKDSERHEYLPDLLQFVRLPLLSAKYITDTIDEEVGITKSQGIIMGPMFLNYCKTTSCAAI